MEKERSWRETIEKNVARSWSVVEKQAHVEADPINPIVTADSGSAANWYAAIVKGAPDAAGIARKGIRTKAQELFTRSKS